MLQIETADACVLSLKSKHQSVPVNSKQVVCLSTRKAPLWKTERQIVGFAGLRKQESRKATYFFTDNFVKNNYRKRIIQKWFSFLFPKAFAKEPKEPKEHNTHNTHNATHNAHKAHKAHNSHKAHNTHKAHKAHKAHNTTHNAHKAHNTHKAHKKPKKKKKEKKQTLLLEKGEFAKLFSPLFETIWLSKPGIVSVQDRGSFVIIQAKKEGEVLLSLDSRLYLIQVLNEEQKKHLTAVNEFLSNRMGLKARLIKDHIHIQGHLYRVKDFQDLSRIASTLNLNYRFSAEVAPSLRPKLQEHIYKNIANLSSPILLWEKPLTALVPNEDSLKNLYQTKLKPFGITVKPDPSLLPTPPLIKIKVLLVESSNNHSFHTHIDFGEKTINRLLDGSLFKDLLSTFQAMEDKGHAQILSSAVLLSESGKESHFHSGGEVPIPYFNPETGIQGIKWKPYGIRLNFTAKADQTDKINVNAHVKISEVDHAHSVRSAPSIKSSSITTSITMKSGQSLLLSKLIRRQKGKSRSAPMEIFRLPLAGQLLSFKGKITGHTRLSIFITTFLLKANKKQTYKE